MLGELLVVIGVLLGGGVWWYTLSTLVNIFRKVPVTRVNHD